MSPEVQNYIRKLAIVYVARNSGLQDGVKTLKRVNLLGPQNIVFN